MQFLYFIPRVHEARDLTPPKLATLGLGHVLDGDGVRGVAARAGPDGGESGGFVFFAGPAERLFPRYAPAEQTWHAGPVPADGQAPAWWVGVQNENRPTEASLRRRRFLAGETLTLGDGADWTIPIARSLVRGDSLPKRPMLGADGRTWTLAELPEFTALCDQAERVGAVIYGAAGKSREMTWSDALESAVMALGTNYRLGPVEIHVLGLFDTTTRVMDVCKAMVDLPAFERMMAEKDAAAAADPAQKKSDPASGDSSSSAGGGGC